MKRGKEDSEWANRVQRWFRKSVTEEGKPYVMDEEQVAAAIDESTNVIVAARAGSGKTRTIVAKIVYLIVQCGVKPQEIMTFVFNANAAREINERLSKICVDGMPIVEGRVRIASTFHAFARKVVYDVCGGKEKSGEILVDKEQYLLEVIRRLMGEKRWQEKITWFIKGTVPGDKKRQKEEGERIEEAELVRFAKMMTQFVNRAQQKYLGGGVSLGGIASEYIRKNEVEGRERVFVELGVECFKRYHWYLLNASRGLEGFEKYGTDFNLIVSWASKLVEAERGKVREWLAGKRYILIDEYQDFSQLFLAAVVAIRGVAREAKLFVVGDDLQAINRFAGSEVEYFKEFERYFVEDCRRLMVTTNYRCDRMVVDTARKFMRKAMGEKGEFRAKSRRMGKVVLVEPRETECERKLVDYDMRVSGKDEVFWRVAWRMVGRTPKFQTVQYVKTLIEIIKQNRKAEGILLLHRNNETNIEGVSLVRLMHGLRWGLGKLGVMSEEEYDLKVRVMTMHKSKGLEAEVVIIIEADEGVIPKTHPDTRLYAVFGETEDVALEDQKRLFYVAMTRAKRRLYIIHDKAEGVGFVKYLGRIERLG